MNKKKAYITTPLFYPNSKLHVGHCYTLIIADCLKKFLISNMFDVKFTVGSDEHGQKIEKKANSMNINPQKFVDEICLQNKQILDALEINFDYFVRTSSKKHSAFVTENMKKLWASKNIKSSQYDGYYCVHCEDFVLYNRAIKLNYKCPICMRELQKTEEKTYFLTTSSDELKSNEIIKNNIIVPNKRVKEYQNMINSIPKKGFNIARLNLKWGIPLPFDHSYTLYVWIDALFGYLSVLNDLLTWKDADLIIHIIGKEILRFHSIYFICLLSKLNLLPKAFPKNFKILTHGWLLNNDEKISKSKSKTVINPLDIISIFGLDSFRIYLFSKANLENDINFSKKDYQTFYNSEIVNKIGNLYSRFCGLCEKYTNSTFPQSNFLFSNNFKRETNKIFQIFRNFSEFFFNYKFNFAVNQIFLLSEEISSYIDFMKPWKMDDFEKRNEFIALIGYSTLLMSAMCWPIFSEKSKIIIRKMFCENFNCIDNWIIEQYKSKTKFKSWFLIKDVKKSFRIINQHLFPRKINESDR